MNRVNVATKYDVSFEEARDITSDYLDRMLDDLAVNYGYEDLLTWVNEYGDVFELSKAISGEIMQDPDVPLDYKRVLDTLVSISPVTNPEIHIEYY